MTQERRAQTLSDAPAASPAGAGASAEDAASTMEVELEEVPPAQLPPVEARPRSASKPAEVSGTRALRDSSPGLQKKKNRMTLRIPDDEVSRPTPAVTSESPPAVAAPAAPPIPPNDAGPIQPTRIVAIGVPSEPPPPVRAPSSPPTVSPTHEDSWTPYQPTAADGALPPARPPATSEELIPIVSETDLEPPPDSGEPVDVVEVAKPVLSKPPPAPPAAPTSAKMPAAAKVPAPAQPPAAPAAQARAQATTEPEGEEIKFDDDDPVAAALTGDRPSDSDEISADDMVSVESAPSPSTKPSPPKAPPTSGMSKAIADAPVSGPPRPRAKSVPSIPPSQQPQAQQPTMRARTASMPTIQHSAPQPVIVPAAPPPGRTPLMIVPPHVGVTQPPPDPGQRRKARPWWEDLFNDDFIRTMAKIADAQIAAEADFIEDSLGVAKGGTMLDLACGTGRHAIELARRGYEVVGFDLSLAMLARAAEEAQERSAKLNFVQGDMRDMTFEDAFDGVFSWNTSFGFFDEDTNAKVIGKIHRALKKGGQFLLDVANRDFVLQQAPSLAWFEGDGCVCMDEMSIDWITSRMRVKRTMMMDDGRSREIEYSIRIYSLHELGRILHEQGFRVAEVSGRTATPGVFFGAESPRTLILAEKR